MKQCFMTCNPKELLFSCVPLLGKYTLIAVLLLSLAGCAKKGPDIEDPKPDDEIPLPPGEEGTVAATYELVVVKADPAHPFDRDTYEGDLDGVGIELVKDEHNRLVFMVPYAVTEGVKTLRIKGIDDQTWTYTIRPSPLKEAATPEVLVDLFDKVKDRFPSAENPELQDVFDQLDQIMASASPQEKQQMSLYYLQNQHLFDELFFADIDQLVEQSAQLPRSTPVHTTGLMASANRQSEVTSASSDKETAIEIAKFSTGVLILGGGGVIVFAAPTPIEKAIGLAAVYVGWRVAKKYKEKIDDRNISIIGFAYDQIVDGIKGQGPRMGKAPSSYKMASTRAGGGGAGVELEFDRDVTLNIQLVRRPLTTQDRNDASYLVQDYFSTFDRLDNIVTKINEVIEWVNKRVPFVSYDTLPQVALRDEAEEVLEPLPEDAYEDLVLGFGQSVDVKSHTWDEDGHLVLHVLPNKRYHTDKVEMVMSLYYQNRYRSITQTFYVTFDMCASVQRLLDEGVNPKQLHDRWYETRCMVGKSYGGGLIGTFQKPATGPDFCVVLSPRPIGSANFATAVQNASRYSGGGYTDWHLPGPNSVYWVAYRDLLTYYQSNGIPVSTTGYFWSNHPLNNGSEDYEADAYAYRPSFGLMYQKISAQHSVWPMRVEMY